MWKLHVRWVASKFDAWHLSVCFAFFFLLLLLNRVISSYYVFLSLCFLLLRITYRPAHTTLNGRQTISTHITTSTSNWATLRCAIFHVLKRKSSRKQFSRIINCDRFIWRFFCLPLRRHWICYLYKCTMWIRWMRFFLLMEECEKVGRSKMLLFMLTTTLSG